MADVFLSYAREDRAYAQQIAQGLQANGLIVFWDIEIPPGASWADHIEHKLADSKAQVVLWSANSTKSQWVREEARMGRDKGVLIPAMIDGSNAPLGFGEVQAADLSAWNGEADSAQWRMFLEAVRARVAAPPVAKPVGAPARAAASAPAAPAAKQGVPTWVWVVSAVVGTIAVLAVIGAMLPDPTQQQAQQIQPLTPQQQAQQQAQQPAQQADQQQQPGQPDYRAQILNRLAQVEQAFSAQGFQRLGEPSVGQLRQAQTADVPATLEAGMDYRVIGVCDNDCGDLDLVLFDQNNNLISQDELVDATPIVEVRPQWSGAFTLRARMHQCSVEPCYYALVLYGRRN